MTFVADDQMMFEQMEQGLAIIEEAERWIAKNPYVWSRMVNQAANFAAQERHFSIALLVEEVRFNMSVEKVEGQDFKLNNDWNAVFARKLKKYPRIAPYIETRSSKVDGLMW